MPITDSSSPASSSPSTKPTFTPSRSPSPPIDVRFTPESGHLQCKIKCPLWVKSRLLQRTRYVGFGPAADIYFNVAVS